MRRLKCILLTLALMLSVVTVISADEGYSVDIDISDLLFDDTVEEVSLSTPAFSDMDLVAENENLKLYFYPTGLDIYVVSNSGKVWSNVIMEEYYKQDTPSNSISSQLITVNACDKEESVKEYVLYDSTNKDIKADYSIEDEKLILDISMDEIELSFKVIFGIENAGFYYYIPDESIQEKNGKIISVSMLQNLGASRNDEKGYIFYPDGSGAIMRFQKSNSTSSNLSQFSIYGNSDVMFTVLERNWEDNIYGALLPVYGISQTNNGFIAVVDRGAADSKINVALPGYQIPDLYRAFITYTYRNYSTTEFNKASVSSLINERIKTDRKCFYYLLSGDDNNYSGMANSYRNHLVNNGTLKEKKDSEGLPISINLLCSVQKNGIFSTSLQKMTTFKQAEGIAQELSQSEIKNLDLVLSGWGKGGWDTQPTTINAEGKLGGNSDLKKLQKYCKDAGIQLSLDVEAILANSDTGSFNARKEATRNYFGDFFINKYKNKYILNSVAVLDNAYSKFSDKYSDFGINLLTVGKLVFPDYNNKNVCTSQEIIDSYNSVMKKTEKDGIRFSTTTGNAYILPYADMIYSLPQRDSGYTFTTESVPFYQMVVHGYIDYTGTVGNTHYDYDKCILEWVETGSIPSYIITEERTANLLETDYDGVFSSEFSVWNKKITETYKKLNKDIGNLHSKQMISHEKLSNGVVKVEYSGGSTVYVNYNETPYTAGNIKVEGKNYLVVGE